MAQEISEVHGVEVGGGVGGGGWEGIERPRKFQRAVDLVSRCPLIPYGVVIQKFNKCKEVAVVIL